MAMLTLALLTGCQTIMSFTPERAVYAEVLNRDEPEFHANPASVQVLQKQAWQDSIMVLVAFQATDRGGRLDECIFLYQVKKFRLGWGTTSGGGGCGPVGGDNSPIGIGAGRHSGDDNYSEVDGLVYEPEITAVEVTWDDGEAQRVEVINGSYLVVRDGAHDYAQVQGLDSQDMVIYTHENPAPAPGKE